MTFKDLHSDTFCECTTGLNENTDDIFSRRISKKQTKDRDFRSNWERGKIPISEECNDVCDCRGVSINIVNSLNESEVMEIYKESRKINPSLSKYIFKFKFKVNAGLLKAYPIDNNPFHYNFFKCDEFSLENIDNLETIEINV